MAEPKKNKDGLVAGSLVSLADYGKVKREKLVKSKQAPKPKAKTVAAKK